MVYRSVMHTSSGDDEQGQSSERYASPTFAPSSLPPKSLPPSEAPFETRMPVRKPLYPDYEEDDF